MFLSVAEDKQGHIRIYLNIDDKLHCTDALLQAQVQSYLQILMEAFISFTDPLKMTAWTTPEKETSFPATARKAVGINEAFSQVWVLQYDDKGRSKKPMLVEEGNRSIINSTFIITMSKLFFTDLASTLQQQKVPA